MDKNKRGKPQFIRKQKLKDVADIDYGFAFNSDFFNEDGNGLPLVRIRDLKRGFTKTYTTEIFDERYLVDSGDMLIGMDGEFNLTVWQAGPALLNQRVCRIRAKKSQVREGYLRFFLPVSLKHIEDRTSCVTVKHLSAKVLNEITLPNHSLTEQQALADKFIYIEKATTLAIKNSAYLDNLVKSRFNEMFGDALNSDNRWPEQTLGSMLDIARGGSPRPIKSYLTNDSDGVNWIKIGDAVNGSRYIANTAERIKLSGVKKSRLVHSGDFLLSNSMSFGRPYILKTDGCIHDGWLVLQGVEEYFDSLFLYQLLASDDMLHKFRGLVRGGVVNNLNKDLVSTVSVMVPPMSMQRDFASLVRQVDKLRFKTQQQIEKLEMLKKSLMQEYFG